MVETLTNLLSREQTDQLQAQFQENPLVILRVATHIGEGRGEWPTESVTAACTALVPVLVEEADKRLMRDEVTRSLITRDVDAALEWLSQIGFLKALMPEVEATRNLTQEGGRHHKDVWEHTKLVVRQAVPRPAVRWGALLHDIGKVPTRTFTEKGVHFHGHAEVGARMFDKMSRRVPFERPMRQKVRFLIKHHLRSNQYSADWSDNAVRRFSREMDAHLVDLLDLSRADITSKRPGRRKHLLHQISELSQRVTALRELDSKRPALPKGLGTAVMGRFDLPASRAIGDLKRVLEAAIERGELEAHQDEEHYLRWLEQSGTIQRLRDGKS